FPLLVEPKVARGLQKYLCNLNILASEMWEVPSAYEGTSKNPLYASLIVLPLSSIISKQDALYISSQVKKYLTKQV
ncbi:MAG: hypothetical protein KGL95_12825, partial [Patescibacteria group bacterium]|nr:hypothetical protein [Patescibacteria group bacterium]